MEDMKIKPELQLVGEDGNAFIIVGRAGSVLLENGYSQEQIAEFTSEATSGNYDHVLQTCMEWFDVY